MGRYNNVLERIKQSKLHMKSLSVEPEIKPNLEDAKINIESEQNKNNIDDLNLMFGKGINLLEEYKLPEEPKKKGRRKKSEFNGSFNF